ncbi:hypothetical protein [Rhizobium rhizogenes]|uniref:hypothetical protein n=1 Tax=Rhizobium rhizogenes TaxID=359 RepID=UPI0022C4C204|nr:hypothetical protein [Rhizobium rhizogenes]MCZ7488155.1 hypothetical protein [Rhizobium rhizogenes]
MSSNGFDPMAQYARLSERVENQGKDIVDLRSNMNTGFQTLTASINGLSNELRTNSKTQWPVIWAAAGVCFTVLAALSTFFYSTINKEQQRLDAALVKSSETNAASISTIQQNIATALAGVVPRSEMEWRQARSAEDRQRMEGTVSGIRSEMVPRAELERIWSSYTQQFSDHQRQLDELKQAQGSVYGARDVILDLRQRLDRVERERLSPPG